MEINDNRQYAVKISTILWTRVYVFVAMNDMAAYWLHTSGSRQFPPATCVG